MSKFLKTLSAAGAILCLTASADAARPTKTTFGLGTEATPAQIAGWNIDVRADGTGLPIGHGSVAEGQAVYDQKCAVCHGTFGESGDYVQLAGGAGTLATQSAVRTVGSLLAHATTLWDYINRAMPYPNSKSLTPNEVYALCAYLLNLNDIVPAETTLDEKSLPQVKMPNQHGFTSAHGFMTVSGKPDVRSNRCMANCATEVNITSRLPDGFVADNYGDIAEQFRGLATMRAAVSGNGVVSPAKSEGLLLAQSNNCLACHGIDQTIVGPAFRSVAKKYQALSNALPTLTHKVRSGGAGVWGSVPMPAQTSPTDADLATILNWVLAGSPGS